MASVSGEDGLGRRTEMGSRTRETLRDALDEDLVDLAPRRGAFLVFQKLIANGPFAEAGIER